MNQNNNSLTHKKVQEAKQHTTRQYSVNLASFATDLQNRNPNKVRTICSSRPPHILNQIDSITQTLRSLFIHFNKSHAASPRVSCEFAEPCGLSVATSPQCTLNMAIQAIEFLTKRVTNDILYKYFLFSPPAACSLPSMQIKFLKVCHAPY